MPVFQTVATITISFVVGAIAYRHVRVYRRVYRTAGAWWKHAASRLQSWSKRARHWLSNVWAGRPVELRGYVRDPTVDFCVTTFEKRARAWRVFATISFIFSLASVVVGILIFIFADRIAIDNHELEDLLARRKTLQSEIDTKLTSMDQDQRNLIISQALLDHWSQLRSPIGRFAPDRYQLPDSINTVEKNSLVAQIPIFQDSRKDLARALTELGIVDSSWLRSANLVMTRGENSLFRQQDRQGFAEALAAKDLNTEDVKRFFLAYFQLTNEAMDVRIDNEEFWQIVSRLSTIASPIREKVDGVYDALTDRKNAAEKKVTGAKAQGFLSLRERQTELREVNEQIAEIHRDFDPTNLYSVVPLLVVRLGAVILLIFLTQILLAAYRYNTMLYTHYASVADALRMVPKASEQTGPDYNALQPITEMLYPKDATYTPPESPITSLVELAKQK